MNYASKDEALYVRAAERAMYLAADGYAPERVSEAAQKRADEVWAQYKAGLISADEVWA